MDMTVAGLLAAYRTQGLTPEAVIAHVLARCNEYRAHNIWITQLTRAQLEPYLQKLHEHSPDSLPLYGIPFAIKDNIDLAGIPTTAACEAFTYTPQHSAFVVQQLIDAGAIPIGKTNLDQFATGLVGTRSPYGACHNAINPEYVSGGSSSGSAVANALGLVSFALGTDTAGSGRVPASFNNIVGVKPSRGIVSTTGVVPACRTLDCVSLFALTTDDANLVLEHMAVYDAGDPYARPNPFSNSYRHYGMPSGAFRFGVPATEQLAFFGDDSARQQFLDSVSKLEALGGIRTEIDFAPFMSAAKLLYDGPWLAERYVATEEIITRQPDAMLPVTRTIIDNAKDKSAVDAFKAEYSLRAYQRQAEQILDAVDFIVTPTAGTIFTIAQVEADPIALNTQLGYYTNFMNLLDCAAIAIPAAYLANGLPWGITFFSRALQDRKLLSYANRWQQAMQLPLGATALPLPASKQSSPGFAQAIPVVVCGAHLDGLPLNWQLRERGAVLAEKTTTAAHYRMYALAGGPPYRPGLIRDSKGGNAIEVEVWHVPADQFGSFVAAIPPPLGIGKLELADGRWLPGFICEGHAIADAKDISALGGWRRYLAEA
ncbi:MAG: allophanate hydrolase [Gammaproteobacteria bacterium]|nr:allophanate hydrolase [Gammaproteobacteria bacterium]